MKHTLVCPTLSRLALPAQDSRWRRGIVATATNTQYFAIRTTREPRLSLSHGGLAALLCMAEPAFRLSDLSMLTLRDSRLAINQ